MAAIAEVFGKVVEPLFELCKDPLRLGLSVEADTIHHVGAIAEEHGTVAEHVGCDRAEFPELPAAYELAGGVVTRSPTPRVLDREQYIIRLGSGDHAIDIIEGSGDRLLAENGLCSTAGSVDGDVGVDVVGVATLTRSGFSTSSISL